jgi:hypothetical protein
MIGCLQKICAVLARGCRPETQDWASMQSSRLATSPEGNSCWASYLVNGSLIRPHIASFLEGLQNSPADSAASGRRVEKPHAKFREALGANPASTCARHSPSRNISWRTRRTSLGRRGPAPGY